MGYRLNRTERMIIIWVNTWTLSSKCIQNSVNEATEQTNLQKKFNVHR